MFVKYAVVNNLAVLPVQLGQVLIDTSGGHHVFKIASSVKDERRTEAHKTQHLECHKRIVNVHIDSALTGYSGLLAFH